MGNDLRLETGRLELVPFTSERGSWSATRLLRTLGRGDFFGEIAALTGETPSADVIAETMLRCLVIPPQELERLLLDPPQMMLRLLRMEARRLQTSGRATPTRRSSSRFSGRLRPEVRSAALYASLRSVLGELAWIDPEVQQQRATSLSS